LVAGVPLVTADVLPATDDVPPVVTETDAEGLPVAVDKPPVSADTMALAVSIAVSSTSFTVSTRLLWPASSNEMAAQWAVTAASAPSASTARRLRAMASGQLQLDLGAAAGRVCCEMASLGCVWGAAVLVAPILREPVIRYELGLYAEYLPEKARRCKHFFP
jgi:hypothetical protein